MLIQSRKASRFLTPLAVKLYVQIGAKQGSGSGWSNSTVVAPDPPQDAVNVTNFARPYRALVSWRLMLSMVG